MRAAICLTLAIATTLGTARSASAFCRASTCRESIICDGEEPFDPACKPLQWKRPCVGVSTQISASNQVPFAIADALVTRSFEVWEEPTCDDLTGAKPNIHVTNMGAVDCNLVEYNSRGGNANLVVFRDGTWPHPEGPHSIALTTVTFDTRTGEIYDADIEVNSAIFTFTTTDTNVQTDLLSVLTHEAGHFLGLTHSLDSNATMWANYTSGLIGPRTLALDDIGGVCVMYPPVDTPIDKSACNPIPRHGFSPACLSKQTEGDCSVSRAIGAPNAASSGLLLCALAALARVRRIKNPRAHRHS